MAEVVILSTGGTIAMDRTPSSSQAVPALSAEDFLDQLGSQLPAATRLTSEDLLNIPSAHITREDFKKIHSRVAHHVARQGVDGVVVTHGTDTMEESSFFLHCCYSGAIPVVFVGAMRSANELGYEGLRNLVSAIRVAASPSARDQGVLIVMNEQVHSAGELRKMHTQRVDAFRSPPLGPIGEVALGRVEIRRRVMRPPAALKPIWARTVPLIALTADVEPVLLGAVEGLRPEGVVLEALGGGRVPPGILPVLGALIEAKVPVVIATRSGVGPVVDDYGYDGGHHHLKRIGCVFAHHLSGSKARILLMLALGNGRRSLKALRELFESGPGAK